MSSTAASIEPACAPGELMRLVAAGLRARGLDVRLPTWEDSRRLLIERAAGRCVLSVDDYGCVEWEFIPAGSGPANPKQMADVATILLTSQGAEYPRLGSGYGQPGTTLKSVVGQELKARGFDVDLEVYEDNDTYDVFAGIVATNPATATSVNVHIGDDGAITWEYEYEAADDGASASGDANVVARPADLADSIVSTVVRAISMYPAVAAPDDSP